MLLFLDFVELLVTYAVLGALCGVAFTGWAAVSAISAVGGVSEPSTFFERLVTYSLSGTSVASAALVGLIVGFGFHQGFTDKLVESLELYLFVTFQCGVLLHLVIRISGNTSKSDDD